MRKKTLAYSLFAALLGLSFHSCKDDFLQEKRDFTGVNEDVFRVPEMAKAYVDYIYGLIQPPNGNNTSLYWELAAGNAFQATTDEIPGQSDFNREWPQISITQSHALQYFGQRMSSSIANNSWTRIRQMNLFLQEADKHGLDEEIRDLCRGQLYFWRAWQYFDLVKIYGGVPLILTPQDPISSTGSENSVPRSPTSECIKQICADLDSAINLLPGRWEGNDWGRITSGAAAALKGRVLLTWASPLFNRADDRNRWEEAYQANLAAKQLLESNGFALYTAGTAPGEAWEKMFFVESGNPEAVMIYGFNSTTSDQTRKNNGWEQNARSKEILGAGGISPTKQLLDAFPMKDGKMPGQSTYTYDPNKFYKNRDPRFYKTFAYNGARWPYRENQNFIQWTYRWYNDSGDLSGNPNATTETEGANASGIYLRKGTDPNGSNSQGNFNLSGTDVMKIRFAEVLLNLGESAIGTERLSEGKEAIVEIRKRAGVENLDGSYGLSSVSSRDEHFAAMLNERKVEFAYEGHRFWDLRRWMLFEAGSPTVARLGFQDQVLDGSRRTGLFVIVKNADGQRYKATPDPLRSTVNGSAPIVDREPAQYPPGITTFEEYLDYLYSNHFEVVEKDDLDPTNPADWTFRWYNEYYFFGLHQNILLASPYLQQTNGWPDLTGGTGTFDPLL
ncbi:RagB/SusD family nutrient uptake outer membrane protein [Sphingobacterium pedocola]|uniref:RagB/SusD family nutrient uptake outer membrane protein n=1 Tax=Sphingobacterium pedocola TaxID=2082722 RepID=A0ABR9T960_9SPHI|nr:RagB/SusD family nutrient uptake outer membrane protein [Sphingobacterium pedocola]MBE8721542.1 RagB/SusD family nutrient uptake outer membrane protein [Sphingobacterium pedocola]